MSDQSERDAKRTAAGPRRASAAVLAVLIFCLVVGAALVALGIPRTVGAWIGLPATPVIRQLLQGANPSPAELQEAIDVQRRSTAWDPAPRRLTDLAYLELSLAQRSLGEARARLLADAEAHVSEGLLRNPAEPFAWIRLALLRHMRGAEPRDIVVALMQSVDMGPNTNPIWLLRAQLLLTYSEALNEDERHRLGSQLRTIWTATPRSHQELRKPLLTLAWLLGKLEVLEAALSDDPETRAQFEAAAKGLVPPRR